MRMKKFIAVLTMAGMMAALAAGCGSDNNSSEGGDSGSDSSWDAANMITAVTREKDQAQEELLQSCSVLLMKMTTI